MRRLSLLALPLVLAACGSNPKLPPIPSGEAVPVNSIPSSEQLLHASGKMIVGPMRHDPVVRERLLRRPANPDDYTIVQGGEIMERTITVDFERLSIDFEPAGSTVFKMMSLMAAADYAEVRGRSSSPTIARQRAEAAKAYLVGMGLPAGHIALSFSTGDPVGNVLTRAGQASNRRVEIEFFITETFDQAKRNNCITARTLALGECGVI